MQGAGEEGGARVCNFFFTNLTKENNFFFFFGGGGGGGWGVGGGGRGKWMDRQTGQKQFALQLLRS